MPGKIADWLDHRIGFRKLRDAMLLEHIPGGAKWRYVWGSTLAFVFGIQLITGLLLMTAYSPSDSSAWGSVHYIQYRMDFGWLIRGLHHFGSQTMMVLIGLHMLQVVIAGAQLPPREVNWWLGLGLLGITFGLGLTGYLLPWDQKGYWATRVATNIAGNVPVIGQWLREFLLGGPDYGNHTLTRFYSFHTFLLPGLLIALLIAHIAVFRRHGVTAPANAQGEGWFWPDQAFRDLVACLAVFGVMLALVIFGGHGNAVTPALEDDQPKTTYQEFARAGLKGWGANLDAPADRDTQGYPARPEWYFLFLFQLLKYFEGPQILVGTLYIPNGVMLLLFLLPLLGYGRMRKFGHAVGVLVVVGLLSGVAALTIQAFADDSPTPILWGTIGNKEVLGPDGKRDETSETGKKANEKVKKAEDFQKSLTEASDKARRACQLAMDGIPVEGARELLRNDPWLKGKELFKTHCAACHKYSTGPDDSFGGFTEGKFTAADLGGHGGEAWIRGLLNNPGDDKYFGLTKLNGMKKWRVGVDKARKNAKPEDIAKEEADFDLIAKWLADQANPNEKRNKELGVQGLEAFERQDCVSCHSMNKQNPNTAPDFTDYGSQDWLRLMIMNPGHKLRFGQKNDMPFFRNLDGPGTDVYNQEFVDAHGKDAKVIHLSDIDRELIIRWMTRDSRVVFGGRPVAGAPKR